jgi:hypothetical protein
MVEENKQKNQTEKIENTNLTYITSPSSKKYAFENENNILIEGKINSKTPDEIYINEYKLTAYKKGESVFYYRLRTDFNNLNA